MGYIELVHVYWNTHRNMWSIRSHNTRRVIDHASVILLADCTYKVNEAGRQRVLREKRKNVHAWVQGHLVGAFNNGFEIECHKKGFVEMAITYNPYVGKSFYVIETLMPIQKSAYAIFDGKTLIALDN